MGRGISNLYIGEQIRRSYQQIDIIVKRYMEAEIISKERSSSLAELMQALHEYFVKYVRLLKGQAKHFDNSDTIEFFSLFMPNKNRNRTDEWGRRVSSFLARTCHELDEHDIYNEICVRFLELLNNYRVFPGVSFMRYITKHLRWSIKAWVVDIAKKSKLINGFYDSDWMHEEACEENDIVIDLPEMNLKWIIEPRNSLFKVLTRYERFLLYLNYKEGLGLRQIAMRLGRTKDTIHAHITEAMNKLRSSYLKGV